MIRFGIIGAGLVARKRAAFLQPQQVVSVYDQDASRAQSLVAQVGRGSVAASAHEVIHHPDVEAVIVATRHDSLAAYALEAIQAGKHVLLEKPGARSAEELLPLLEASHKSPVRVRLGYNHRYHPALQEAQRILATGQLGPLFFLRGRYGHGGRVGYEKEWRADPKISGGGELIDQGVHLIDLARWFLGDFSGVYGTLDTFFWKMSVEDNAFLELKTAAGQIAWLHASCTEWKNLFSLEIYGRDGKLQIDGLGGSYGTEGIIHYQMKPEMGPPGCTANEFPGPDESWKLEMEEFERDIHLGRDPIPGLNDGLAVLKIVEQLYRQNAPSSP